MFVGVGLFNLFNLLYHFFMLRMLSPVDYGYLNTLVALFMVISVPAGTVQTAVTKYVSSFHAQNHFDHVKSLLGHLFFLMLIIGLSLFILISLSSSLISSFLQISSEGLVLLLGITLFFAMVIPVPWGGLQGLQKFGSLTFNLILNGGLKLVLSISFVLLGWRVFGALSALAIAYFITTVFSLLILKMNLSKEKKKANPELSPVKGARYDLAELYCYFIPVGLTLFCFMVLTNMDLILVKHFFTAEEAGYYSIAQMIGKIILFLPQPIVMVMFPKVSLLEAQKKEAFPVLMRSLVTAGSLCILGVIFCHLFPMVTLQMLTGTVYPECIPLVKRFSINMSFFSLIVILLYYHLAKQRRGFLYLLFFLTLIQVGAIGLWHQTMLQVLSIVGLVALFLLGLNLYLVCSHSRR
jgi:O-antigen/teichoic acid export membrane protein